MAIMILDPLIEKEVREQYVPSDERCTETWNGVEVVPPDPSTEHQDIQYKLLAPLAAWIFHPDAGQVFVGVNISDRSENWKHNYRIPDGAVYLHSNPATNHGTHWQGGPDFLVEIISDGEDPYAKFDFYAKVNTREILLVLHDPWAVELHRLEGDRFTLVGRSNLENPVTVESAVLPLTFRLAAGTRRPVIEIANTATGQRWTA